MFPGGSLINTALGIGNDLLGLVGGEDSGGGGGGGGMMGAAVNLNLDEVKHEMASIKHDTGAIRETLAGHGDQLVDIKVGLFCTSAVSGNKYSTDGLRVVERPRGRTEQHCRGHRQHEVPAGQHTVHCQQVI